MSYTEILDQIDGENNVVGHVTKEEAYKNKIPHRIVHIMVCWNRKVFIPRRSMKVRYLPGCYCSSAGGHVRSGESSVEGALRELKEEIGLSGPIEQVKEFFYTHDFLVHTTIFVKKYSPAIDHIKLDPEEVMSGDFYSRNELNGLDWSQAHPQLFSCVREIENYL